MYVYRHLVSAVGILQIWYQLGLASPVFSTATLLSWVVPLSMLDLFTLLSIYLLSPGHNPIRSPSVQPLGLRLCYPNYQRSVGVYLVTSVWYWLENQLRLLSCGIDPNIIKYSMYPLWFVISVRVWLPRSYTLTNSMVAANVICWWYFAWSSVVIGIEEPWTQQHCP